MNNKDKTYKTRALDYIKEPGAAYGIQPKKQGTYTIEDYYALPEDVRAELIDGVLILMEAPSSVHQLISAELCRVLRNEIEKRNGTCLPFAAPLDVQLDCDDKTMLQPDVIVICDRSKVIKRCIYGAPEFVVEILSPSTRKKDMQLKLLKYDNAGVKEYWMIDPYEKDIIICNFENDKPPRVFGFEDRIPVTAFGDDITVDFGKIYDYISFLYEADEV